MQHRVLLGDAWSPSELRQASGVGQGLYIVTTWYVVETIGDMINSNRDFVGILGFHMGVNMDFMVDGHPYHFFRGIHRPKGHTWRCSWGRD